MSLLGRGVIQQESPRNTVMTLVGWWTMVYPNDLRAVLHYTPVELAWFLLKHIAVHGPIGQQLGFSPFRSGIASLAGESWAQLGRYFNDLGQLQRRPVGNDMHSIGSSARHCSLRLLLLASLGGALGCTTDHRLWTRPPVGTWRRRARHRAHGGGATCGTCSRESGIVFRGCSAVEASIGRVGSDIVDPRHLYYYVWI